MPAGSQSLSAYPIKWSGPNYKADIFTELSFRLGTEVLATQGSVQGTPYNDRIIVNFGVAAIDAGGGRNVGHDGVDIVGMIADVVNAAINIPIIDLGPGADTLVISDGDRSTSTVAEINYVVPSLDEALGDRIILPDFDPNSAMTYLGNNVLEITDTDGDVLIVNFVDGNGGPVDAGSLGIHYTLGQPPAPLPAVVGGRPLLIIAEDVEGEALSDTLFYLNDSFASATADGGAGDDVIAPFGAGLHSLAFEQLNGGLGNDWILAVPSVDGHVNGGPGADHVFFNYNQFGNASSFSQGDQLNMHLEGGAGNDSIWIDLDYPALANSGNATLDILADGGAGRDTMIWTDHNIHDPGITIGDQLHGKMLGGTGNDNFHIRIWGDPHLDIFGGQGRDVVDIVSDARYADGLAREVVNVHGGDGDGAVDASDFLIWRSSANARSPVAGTYDLDGGKGGPDIYDLDFSGLGGGTFFVHLDDFDFATLHYDTATQPLEECLIFDLGSGGIQAGSTPEMVALDGFAAQTTEVMQTSDGFQFFDTATGALQTIGFEYFDGRFLTAQDLTTVLVDGGDYLFV